MIHPNAKCLIPALLAATTAGSAMAQDLSVVGSWSSLPLHKTFEAPFWNETLPGANPDLSVQMTTFDQMGIQGSDVMRMLGDGVFDVGMTVGDYAVDDAPELEGLDVPLLATTAAEARAMVDAYRPMIAEVLRETFNAELLAIAPYPPQVMFCRPEVASLDDLEGLKIRGSGRMTTLFLEALGAEGVNLAFAETPGALERGVVDCAVTGAGSGYASGWWEVSSTLYAIPLGGWDPVVTAMNLDTWESLDAETQAMLKEAIATEFEAPAWEAADASYQMELDCLGGSADCTLGDPADMTVVQPSEADLAQAKEILIADVLPDWGTRVSKDWLVRWNDTVGATTGVSVPVE